MSSNWILNHKITVGIRTVFLVIILIYGWWIIASFRTQTFGTEKLSNHLIAATLFVLPFCIIPFIGLKSELLVKCTITLFTAILFTALVWGRVEEFVVTQETSTQGSQSIVIKRWWPFEHHVIVYSPQNGWHAND